MRSDDDILNHIRTELQWDQRLDGANIITEIRHGQVVITGRVNSYAKMVHAEEAVRRVAGVKSVSNQLQVIISEEHERSDEELMRLVKNTIRWNSSISEDQINVSVKNAWVTLDGEVDWEYQRSKARLLTQDIIGVRGITNLLKVRSDSAAA